MRPSRTSIFLALRGRQPPPRRCSRKQRPRDFRRPSVWFRRDRQHLRHLERALLRATSRYRQHLSPQSLTFHPQTEDQASTQGEVDSTIPVWRVPHPASWYAAQNLPIPGISARDGPRNPGDSDEFAISSQPSAAPTQPGGLPHRPWRTWPIPWQKVNFDKSRSFEFTRFNYVSRC